MKTISRYIMTLALLITAVGGAWAQTTVTWTEADLTGSGSDLTTYTKDGVTIKCGDRLSGGKSFNGPVTISTTLGNFTKIEITGQGSAPIASDIFTNDGNTATWTGNASSLNFPNAIAYATQFVFTIVSSGPEVTLNADNTEATMEMPASDVTVTYELVRDIATGVKALVNNGAECIYVTKVEDKFVPKEAITYKLTDVLDQNNQFDLVEGTDYEKVGMHILDGYTWKDVTDESDLKPGTYEIIFKGLGKYDGNVYSQEFLLSNGYELTIAAGEYATFYHNEALYVDDEDAVLYTIANVTDTEAVLSDAITVAPAETPLLVYNKSEQAKTFLLIPTAEPDLALTMADAFKGTLDAKEFSKDDMEAAVYYVCTGKAFAPVKSAGTIAANRCWLEISTAAPSNARKIVHGDATKITNTDRTDLTDGDLYDLNGRKVLNPTKKGIYIKNGKKVVIK